MKGKGMKLRLCAVAIALTAAAVLWGCAPTTLYSIDMRYAPVKPISVGERPCGDRRVAVAVFHDARPAGDPLRIGTVIEPGGGRVPVLPEKVTAGEAVSSGIRSTWCAPDVPWRRPPRPGISRRTRSGPNGGTSCWVGPSMTWR